jgi:hypothetical protein
MHVDLYSNIEHINMVIYTKLDRWQLLSTFIKFRLLI